MEKENKILISESEADIFKDLEEIKIEYNKKIEEHKRQKTALKIIYYSMGILATCFSALTTFLVGDKSFNSNNDPIVITSFVFSILSLFIHIILNFSGVEQKIGKHTDTQKQYQTLKYDLKNFMRNKNITYEDIINFTNIANEQQKLILTYEIGSCF